MTGAQRGRPGGLNAACVTVSGQLFQSTQESTCVAMHLISACCRAAAVAAVAEFKGFQEASRGRGESAN